MIVYDTRTLLDGNVERRHMVKEFTLRTWRHGHVAHRSVAADLNPKFFERVQKLAAVRYPLAAKCTGRKRT